MLNLLVIPLHLLVVHLLFDRHYTKFSISQRKPVKHAFMELLTAALLIFVPSVPKGKKNVGTEKIRICLLCGKTGLVNLSKTHPFGKTNPGLEKKSIPKDQCVLYQLS